MNYVQLYNKIINQMAARERGDGGLGMWLFIINDKCPVGMVTKVLLQRDRNI